MRVILLIDTLNSGGAQRQIVNLGILLQRKGVDVSVVYYHPLHHFKETLDKENVTNTYLESSGKLDRFRKIRRHIKTLKPDILLCFLDIPSMFGVLASLMNRKWRLITSERVLETGKPGSLRRILRWCYRFVDAVTSNSFANDELIKTNAPWASDKTFVIYNSVDLDKFSPAKNTPTTSVTRFLVVASFRETKNPQGLFRAIDLVRRERADTPFELHWFGHKNQAKGEDSSSAYKEAIQIRKDSGLESIIQIHEPVVNIEEEYRKSTALILPSFTEGVPNVVCEAMATGLPIIMSKVADATRLVEPSQNGFLFDPHSPEDMAGQIIRCLDLNAAQQSKMSKNSRLKAEQLFSPDDYVDKYTELFKKVLNEK